MLPNFTLPRLFQITLSFESLLLAIVKQPPNP